ncbi:TrmH family RNA methyltransferase [Treponema phagedenis]|uniref:TrmH family RNA methyltransferase n=1 Tax=Treponema phagedenis TaxID=162 RepID=UPI0001F63F39|nr:RNA methyltransferase [Treponema phagedenis]EFW37482.1 RNA methyltransferase, TrmH family [Treponema phagedenis F0421]NVP24765.1 RNA methyltransferase [Treponema phagedenis]QEJ95877.1 RNA methyltransferase [Treponema phagedenis]QKS93075.1 RNA methyltransferase [Treponema phagedenis]QLC58952.1 RNA methyltransferase [Treponema phagedenis]
MGTQHRKELPVCGFEAVKALVKQHPEKISRLFFTQERAKAFGDASKYLAAKKRLYRVVEEADLEKLSLSVHHQGVVAMIEEPVIPLIDEQIIDGWAKDSAVVLFLDRVGNSNNLGAIIRSAAFFGIPAVIITDEDPQAKITTSAYRVAQGGMEFVTIYHTRSIQWLLRACEGKITRIGADHRSFRNLNSLPTLLSPDEATMIILGNEETGLSEASKKACDHLVKIPGSGAIESLNVAQAGTLFLAALADIHRQR